MGMTFGKAKQGQHGQLRASVVLILLVLFAVTPIAYGQINMVTNGSFESNVLPASPGYIPSTTYITGWTASNTSWILNGNALPVFYVVASNGAVPNGADVVGCQGGGTLTQPLTGLTNGAQCTLTFYVCKRASPGGNIDFTVTLGSQTIFANTTISWLPFTLETVTFVYNSSWGNVLSLNVSNPVGDATVLIDNVVLNASLCDWPFDVAGNTQGWTAQNQIAGGWSVANSLLSYDITSGATDPMWDNAVIALPRSSYTWLMVRARNTTTANAGRIFWNFGSGLSGNQSQAYALNQNDTQVSEYWTNLSATGAYWTSGTTITELRCDLPDAVLPCTGTHFDVDEIKLSASGPPAPQATSITRYSPATAPPNYTNSATLTWDVRFNHSMTTVATNDFVLTTLSGTAAGSIASVTPMTTAVPATATWFQVTANVSGTGQLRLDNVTGGSGRDVASQAISAGYTSGDVYYVDRDAPSVTISAPSTTVTNGGPVTYTVTFADSGSGLASSTMAETLNTTGTANGSVGVTGSNPYTVTISGITGDGSLGFVVLPASAIDHVGNASAETGSASFTVDNTPLTATLSTSAGAYINTPTGAITVNVVLSEAVTDMALGSISTTNAVASGLTSSDSTHYSFTLTPSVEGPFTCQIAANAIHDPATNGNTASNTISCTWDKTPPTVTLSSANDGGYVTTLTGAITVNVVLSEAVTDMALGSISTTNAVASALTPGDATHYSFTLTPSTEGPFTCQIAANAIHDPATNGNTASNTISCTWDKTPPTVTLSTLAGAYINTPTAATITVDIVLSEAVTDMALGKISTTNAVASAFTSSDTTHYSFTLTASTEGPFSCSIAANAIHDPATNGNTASNTISCTWDKTPPTVTLSSANDGGYVTTPTGAITVNVVLSEAVTDMALGSISTTNAVASALTPGDATHYSFTLTPATEGPFSCSIAANALHDPATNGNTASNTISCTWDKTPPTVTLSTSAGAYINTPTGAFTVDIVLSEAVTDMALGKITTTNAVASALTSSDSTHYSFTLTPSTEGPFSCQIAANAIHDPASNGNTASNTISCTWDKTPPTVTLSTSTGAYVNTPTGVITVNIVLSEAVTDMALGSISTTNAVASALTPGDATHYSFTLTPSTEGPFSCSIAADAIHDPATNGNTASNIISCTWDKTPPTVTLSTLAGPYLTTPLGVITVNIVLSEAVTDMALGNISVSNAVASALTSSDATHYSFTLTPATQALFSCSIAANAIHDPATNGNTASNTISSTWDKTPPTVTVASLLTNNPTPTVSGTVSDNVAVASVSITVNGHTYPATLGSGTWTAVISDALGGGVYDVQAFATDTAGNVATDGTTNELVVDLTPPTVTVTSQITGNATPTVSGTVTDNVAVASVSITVNGHTYPATLGSGTWTVTVPDALPEGTYDVQAQAMDTAGNTGVDTTTNELTVNFSVPAATVNVLTTNNPAPLVTGTATAQAGHTITSVSVTINGLTYPYTPAPPSNSVVWSVTPAALADGTYDVQVGATDDIGRAGTNEAVNALTIDTVAPTATITLDAATPTSADSVAFSVDFSETLAAPLTAANVSLTPGSLAGAIVVSGSAPNYTVTVTMTNANADGTVGITVASGVLADLAGNLYAGGVSPVYTIQNWHGFTTQPTNTRAYTGDSHTFAVVGNYGEAITPTYQWKWNDQGAKTIHLGPTTTSWALTGLTSANDGLYWCEVTYDGTLYESAQATLAVENHLQITTPPEPGTVNVGQSYTFTVVASGGYTPLTYVWKKDGNLIPNATTASYTKSGLALTDEGLYTVEVSDTNTDVQSAEAQLTIIVVQNHLPVAGAGGLATLLGFIIIGSIRKMRRK